MFFENKRMNSPTTQAWVVYDLDADEVIGSWQKYADADQFWADGLYAQTNWAVFPEEEVCPLEVM